MSVGLNQARTFHSDYFFDESAQLHELVNDNTDAPEPPSDNTQPTTPYAQRLGEEEKRAMAALANLDLSNKKHASAHHVGPFLLGPILGRGSIGTVRLGVHKDTGFQVAFKVMKKKHLNASPRLWAKVRREIAIMKLIEHPHVLKLYDVLETPERIYLVLEHVTGGELFDYIISRGRLSREECFRLLAQITQGLEHCHANNICHRDLKPENLLLDDKMNVKIADFGLAQLMPHHKLLHTSCGSPHYASPEVVRGGAYDGRKSDVWSLGVVLFAMSTGSLPFESDQVPELLDKVVKGEYVMPPDVPHDIAQLISMMLVVDVNKRIPLNMLRHTAPYKGTNYFNVELKPILPWAGPIPLPLDESLLGDMEAMGYGRVDDIRNKLSQQIRQEASSNTANGAQGDKPIPMDSRPDEDNLEIACYRLLLARRTQRINELSKLSPKTSSRTLGLATPGSPGGHGLSSRARPSPIATRSSSNTGPISPASRVSPTEPDSQNSNPPDSGRRAPLHLSSRAQPSPPTSTRTITQPVPSSRVPGAAPGSPATSERRLSAQPGGDEQKKPRFLDRVLNKFRHEDTASDSEDEGASSQDGGKSPVSWFSSVFARRPSMSKHLDQERNRGAVPGSPSSNRTISDRRILTPRPSSRSARSGSPAPQQPLNVLELKTEREAPNLARDLEAWLHKLQLPFGKRAGPGYILDIEARDPDFPNEPPVHMSVSILYDPEIDQRRVTFAHMGGDQSTFVRYAETLRTHLAQPSPAELEASGSSDKGTSE